MRGPKYHMNVRILHAGSEARRHGGFHKPREPCPLSLGSFKRRCLPIGCGGAKEPEIGYFSVNRGATEPGNPQNHGSVMYCTILYCTILYYTI